MKRDVNRHISDKVFTGVSGGAIILLCCVLLLVLTPMFVRGASAVLFYGTVEFRKMQLELPIFDRGDAEEVDAEVAQALDARQEAFDILARFREGLDTSILRDQAREMNRAYGDYLRTLNLDRAEYRARRQAVRDIRDGFEAALASSDNAVADELLLGVAEQLAAVDLGGTPAEGFVGLVEEYQEIVARMDLSKREQYAAALDEVQEALRGLFGPLPGEAIPPLAMNQYGATRWSRVKSELDNLLWAEEWREVTPGEPLEKVRIARTEQFAGTELADMFGLIENNIEAMMLPRFTFYWQYFIDDSTPGHYFGGVGPEILGTFLLTLIAMAFSVPLGIISAAYLVECAGDNVVIRVIRTCINTLAGVPSIVFGLFGLAFFVLFLLPVFGLGSQKSILAGGMTLAILVLPVIIRASEEAIRSVPRSYKEASLALGAGNFRTFVTVTLPAALPGILTGIILSLSRAAGETAPILFTGAVALGPIAKSILQPTRALSYGSYDMAVGDRLSALVPHQQYGMVMTLILLVLCLNVIAIVIRSKVSKKLRGY
ncbi:MAG: phosphate ABC transporter permease PstA [Sedimentisphaerales bacterium]|nr:phosphate ABC transporter permease PstA [Sedimentisphaerales bacterium]